MMYSSGRIGHDIVLLPMPSVFRGTLDVLSLVPGTHLPVKESRFYPQFPAFRLIRPGTRLGTASFLATGSSASTRNGVLTVRRQSLPPILAKAANAECIPADTASTEPLASMLTKAAATWNVSQIAVIR